MSLEPVGTMSMGTICYEEAALTCSRINDITDLDESRSLLSLKSKRYATSSPGALSQWKGISVIVSRRVTDAFAVSLMRSPHSLLF
jgi:hypothetical protein